MIFQVCGNSFKHWLLPFTKKFITTTGLEPMTSLSSFIIKSCCTVNQFRANQNSCFDVNSVFFLLPFELYINRGYYTVARRYKLYFRVIKTIFYEGEQRVSKILSLPRENKIHIFKSPCNFLFIIKARNFLAFFAQTTV